MHKSFRHIRSRYRMNPSDYETLWSEQDGRCAACGREPSPGGKGNANARLFIDHNHSTGDIRGLLCQQCNAAIGLAYDSPAALRAMAEYLEREPRLRFSDLAPLDRGSYQRSKTVCANGHPYSPENTYVAPGNGHRQCRTCRRIQDERRRPNRLARKEFT